MINCTVNSMPIQWVNKMKYLGVNYLTNTGRIDTSSAVGKFYGNFNNIMSVLGSSSLVENVLLINVAICL